MNEMQQFEEFFKKMGVEYEVFTNTSHFSVQYGTMCITVSQALFWFNGHGEFTGVEDDEMAHFRPRIK